MESSNVSPAEKIRWRLDAGALPCERPSKAWAGFGAGEICSACDEKIHPAQVMFEVDWSERTYRFHAGCHGLWTAELIRRGLYTPE